MSSPAVLPIAQTLQRAAQFAASGKYKAPFPWDTPPPGHVARNPQGSKVVPDVVFATTQQVNQTIVLQYQCPANKFFVVKRILMRYDGDGPFVQGSGDVVFTIDIDNPNVINQGYVISQGRSLPDFGQWLFNVGSFDFGPVDICGDLIINPNETIRVKAYATANVATGGNNRFNAWISGWEWDQNYTGRDI